MEHSNNLLNALTRQGVLINVSVRYWRGQKKLKAEDLGLESVSDRLISLGHKRLLPKEALQELALVEGRAHSLIEHNTFPFLNGLAHFLPNGRLAEVTGKLGELEEEFKAAQDRFLGRYSSLRASAADEWRVMAEKMVDDPNRLVAAIEAAFPRTLGKFFGFEVSLFQIGLPECCSMELVTLGEQQDVIAARQKAVQEAGQHIRHESEKFVADCVATLREQTAILCEEMLLSIQQSGAGVHQKTLNRLIRFIDQFKQMNFVNDQVMEEQLEQVRRQFLGRTAEEYRESATASNRLVDGLTRLAGKARELAGSDNTQLVQRFGELGRRKFSLAA